MALNLPKVAFKSVTDFDKNCDALVLVNLDISPQSFGKGLSEKYQSILNEYKQLDPSFEGEGGVLSVPDGPIKKLVYSPVGPINRDYDDVRRFYDAAVKGVKRALKSGVKKPLLALPFGVKASGFNQFELVTMLGAYEAIYVPIEIREAIQTKAAKVDSISFISSASLKLAEPTIEIANAIELGRAVARDIGGSDPERMSAPNVVEYVTQLFKGSPIKVEIISDPKKIEKEFPCLGAVNRASVDRHLARVILLRYDPPEEATKTLFFVGKGVTYDTGGSDIKAGGIMAGMHRDKCGAAAVGGLFQTIALMKPKKTRIFGAMAMVRNSIGPNGYVADELITSRAGVRIRVGNTDAEGRMAMVDLLAFYKEQIIKEKLVNPEMFTIATLTGHACLAVGDGYSIVLDNGPARLKQTAQKLQQAGDEIGDMFEISTIRREDYDFNKGKSEYEDILQCNNAASSRTARGHQLPAAFLIQVSGLEQHGIDSSNPIPFSHLDIAASSGPFPGIPSGAPIAALTNRYLIKEN